LILYRIAGILLWSGLHNSGALIMFSLYKICIWRDMVILHSRLKSQCHAAIRLFRQLTKQQFGLSLSSLFEWLLGLLWLLCYVLLVAEWATAHWTWYEPYLVCPRCSVINGRVSMQVERGTKSFIVVGLLWVSLVPQLKN